MQLRGAGVKRLFVSPTLLLVLVPWLKQPLRTLNKILSYPMSPVLEHDGSKDADYDRSN